MSDGKWKFTEQYTQKTSSEKIQRGGMILIFCIGMILLVGGLLFNWKIGLFDSQYFWGHDVRRIHRTEISVSALLSLPWIAGAFMTAAAIRHFCQRRKK